MQVALKLEPNELEILQEAADAKNVSVDEIVTGCVRHRLAWLDFFSSRAVANARKPPTHGFANGTPFQAESAFCSRLSRNFMWIRNEKGTRFALLPDCQVEYITDEAFFEPKTSRDPMLPGIDS